MKYPLVAVVVCYAVGLLLAASLHLPVAALFAVSFAVFAFALALKKLRPFLVWPLLVLVGWTNLAVQNAVLSPDDLRTLMANEPALATVRGTLVETPSLKIYDRDDEQTERTLATIRVSELRRGESWQPASGTIIATTPGVLASNFFNGQPVEISGILSRPPLPVAEGLFDYRTYLQRKGIYNQLKAASTNDWESLSSNRTPPFSDRFRAWAKQTLARGLPDEDEPLKLLWAMSLGWKTALTGEVAAPFMKSGTIVDFAFC